MKRPVCEMPKAYALLPMSSVRRWVSTTYFSAAPEAGQLIQLGVESTYGKFLTIVGPSGCGKTTTVRLMTGMFSAGSPTKAEALTASQPDVVVPAARAASRSGRLTGLVVIGIGIASVTHQTTTKARSDVATAGAASGLTLSAVRSKP